MSLITAMYNASSALQSYGNGITVVGNNLANVNTTGFKGSNITFADVLSQAYGSSKAQGANQIGNGVSTATISPIKKEGAFVPTPNVTDMAIDGEGYFVVHNTAEKTDYYTRAGDFKEDLNNQLVTNGGLHLQGFQLNTDGTFADPTAKDIVLPSSGINPTGANASAAQITSTVKLSVNLDAASPVLGDTTYSPQNNGTYNFSASIKIYDSLGQGHDVEVQFRKIDANTWEWHPVVKSSELSSQPVAPGVYASNALDSMTDVTNPTLVPPVGGLPVMDSHFVRSAPTGANYTPGILKFNNSGLMVQEGSTPIKFTWANAAPQEVLFDFGKAAGGTANAPVTTDSTNDFGGYVHDPQSTNFLSFAATPAANTEYGNSGGDGTVQLSSGFATLNVVQDGYGTGFLQSLQVDPLGRISGMYTNGQTKPLWQVELAQFQNPEALAQKGANLLAKTDTSGDASPNWTATKGYAQGFGTVVSNTLEQSNVEMSQEMIRLISLQRSFQANSKIVSTADTMTEDLVNVKR